MRDGELFERAEEEDVYRVNSLIGVGFAVDLSDMEVKLSPQTQKLLEDRMKDGDYTSPDEAIRIALQSLDGEDVEDLDPETQAAIERALAQADRGEGLPLDEAMAKFRQEHPGL